MPGGIGVLRNLGHGSFGPVEVYPPAGRSLAAADVDGDSLPDVAVTLTGEDHVAVLLNQFPGDCSADFDTSGCRDTRDVLAFLNAFSAGDPAADFNGDGTINAEDLADFLNAFNAGC